MKSQRSGAGEQERQVSFARELFVVQSTSKAQNTCRNVKGNVHDVMANQFLHRKITTTSDASGFDHLVDYVDHVETQNESLNKECQKDNVQHESRN